jgi:dTDP-4-amino-4,6-dideoxygalactose transaminase
MAGATVFSFYATKTITTGEGGMITFADPGIAKKARALRLHGIDRDVFCRDQIVGASWRYEVVAAGFGYNMMDMVAAIGIVQLKRARGLHQARARLWDAYDAALADLPIVLPPKARRGDLHSCHLYAIRLSDDAPIDRDTFITEMARLGVNCSVHFIPLHLHRFWRETLHVSEEMFPNAQRAFERVVSLPLFPSMTIDTQCHITDAVRELLA